MGKVIFNKIGTGSVVTTKKGTKAIRLKLDPKTQEKILPKDFEDGFWIFRDKNTVGQYTVMAPISIDKSR